MEEQVIKMLLQPIVENAVFHGLEPHVGMGSVKVEVRKLGGNRIAFIVSDDGCGISAKNLAEIRRMIANPVREEQDDVKKVGIMNVVRRLSLYYNDEAEFLIDSAPDEGTLIKIIIPGRKA